MNNTRKTDLPAQYARIKLMYKVAELKEQRELKYINKPDPEIKLNWFTRIILNSLKFIRS